MSAHPSSELIHVQPLGYPKERGIKNTDDTAFRSFFVSTFKSMEVIGHNVATAALSQSKINLISRRTQPPWWREHSPGHLTCAQEPRCDLSFLLLVVLFLFLCLVLDQLELRVVSRDVPWETRQQPHIARFEVYPSLVYPVAHGVNVKE